MMPHGQGMHGTNLSDMSDWESCIWFSSTELFAACWDLSLFLCMRDTICKIPPSFAPRLISYYHQLLPAQTYFVFWTAFKSCTSGCFFFLKIQGESPFKNHFKFAYCRQWMVFYQNPKPQSSSPHQKKWNFTHSKDTIVLVPKPKSSILLTSTYLIFELWNSHTTDNSLEPEPKNSILLASSFLIFSFVKFTYHRHCSGTKIHWQRSCTQRQELNSPSLNHTWFSRYEIHMLQTMWLYQNPKRPKNLNLFISSFLVSKLWKRFTSGRQVFLCRKPKSSTLFISSFSLFKLWKKITSCRQLFLLKNPNNFTLLSSSFSVFKLRKKFTSCRQMILYKNHPMASFFSSHCFLFLFKLWKKFTSCRETFLVQKPPNSFIFLLFILNFCAKLWNSHNPADKFSCMKTQQQKLDYPHLVILIFCSTGKIHTTLQPIILCEKTTKSWFFSPHHSWCFKLWHFFFKGF